MLLSLSLFNPGPMAKVTQWHSLIAASLTIPSSNASIIHGAISLKIRAKHSWP